MTVPFNTSIAARRGPPSLLPVVNVREQCGAKGDGMADDTEAFHQAAALIQKAGGGTLVIPKGVYRVGRQRHVPGETPYYQGADIFAVRNLEFLRIVGNKATLKITPGLRFGSFDAQTGQPLAPTPPFYDGKAVAAVGNLVSATGCRNVIIEDLTLDGSSDTLTVGGMWGDTGRQLPGSGLVLYNNGRVRIRGVHSHHHALDGAIIGWTGLKESAAPTPHELRNCVFEFNGRQGLSWVGGRGLTARKCRFAFTGRGKLSSAPGAGVDIEAEESVCRDGLFEECEFWDNAGCGMVADSGNGGYTRFVRCSFWGTTSWTVWSLKPGLVYDNCRFHGSAVHTIGSPNPELATRFKNCRFEDRRPTGNDRVYRGSGYLMETDGGGENVLFENCTFTAKASRSLWFGGAAGRGRFANCTFVHRYAKNAPGEFACVLRNVDLVGCRFREELPRSTGGQTAAILTGKTRVLPGPPTVVSGPQIRWNNRVGTIPTGEY